MSRRACFSLSVCSDKQILESLSLGHKYPFAFIPNCLELSCLCCRGIQTSSNVILLGISRGDFLNVKMSMKAGTDFSVLPLCWQQEEGKHITKQIRADR